MAAAQTRKVGSTSGGSTETIKTLSKRDVADDRVEVGAKPATPVPSTQ